MNPKIKLGAPRRSLQTVQRELLNELLPYQRRWVSDPSRWKFGLMARQVGKDQAAGCEGILDCLKAESKGQKIDWLIVAPSERQSLEALQRWKESAERANIAIAG